MGMSRRAIPLPRGLCVALALLGCLGARPLLAETILLDGVHAHNLIERGLAPGVRNYHELHAPRWALARQVARGARVHEIREGRLRPQVLEGVDLLYVNLVSSDRAAFFPSEIEAVTTWVDEGGSLLLITDHSNCYHHINVLEPLAEALDLRLWRESALESPPQHLASGPGWIVIDRFRDHPVTAGLRWISFQTGCPVDDRWAVATTSEGGWGDQAETSPYGEHALRRGNLGNYGNFRLDDGERRGPLAVLAAKEVGAGRIVVVGDQNVFGDVWIRYGDNLRLFENVMTWLLRRDASADPSLDASPPRVLLLEDPERRAFGDDTPTGLYHAFVALARQVDTAVHDRVEGDPALVVVAPRGKALSTSDEARLASHLERGGKVLWLVSGAEPSAVSSEGLAALRARLAAKHRSRLITVPEVERFLNDQVAAPTVTPNATQQEAEASWLQIVRDHLPTDR